jgi:hypothetical protein
MFNQLYLAATEELAKSRESRRRRAGR